MSEGHWFEPLAEHLGTAYLRYSFTQGTEQEVDFLVKALDLQIGQRVLDVGCGPGRHALALAARGFDVVGIDIAQRFIEIATERAPAGASVTFMRMDARDMPFRSEFDVAISLCQGAFGLVGPVDDLDVLRGMATALRPGGRLALSAFSSYFCVRHPIDTGRFDVATGVHHENTSIKDERGRDAAVELWTTCYTVRELTMLCDLAGLHVDDVWSVSPGDYGRAVPTVEEPELLVTATRPT